MKSNKPRIAVLLAFAIACAPLAGISDSYAGGGMNGAAKAKAANFPPLPTPEWPFPCPPSGSCHPHWFYLVNGATVTFDQPLVVTVSNAFQSANGTFPYPQPPAENGVTEPTVPVGISGSGLTLQPRNTTPYADNQMWYAVEASSANSNPSYLISSLPPAINPAVIGGKDSSPASSLALGYVGNPALTSPGEGISAVAWSRTLGMIGSATQGTVFNDYATVTTAGANNFQTGQIVNISGNSNSAYNGTQTVQSVSGNSFTFNIPFQYASFDGSIPNGNGGTATAMAAVYLSQQNSQHLDSTYGNSFQQWSYSATDRTVCNQLNVCLYSVDAAPQAGSIVSAGPKPSTVTANYQWYFYPDRALSQILQESPVPFPALTKPQEIRAQTYIATKLNLPPPTGCTYNGVTYVGLRCQYSNLAAPLSTYVSLLSAMKKPSNVAPATWKRVKTQLISELSSAIAVQNLFAQVEFIYNTVFLGSEDLINQDLADLAVDLTDRTAIKRFSWQSLAEGLIYTALNIAGTFFGDPKAGSQTEKLYKGIGAACGVTANLMETGWNTAMAEDNGNNDPLLNQFEDLSADLYSYFFQEFTVLGQFIGNQEIQVLQDWGQLQLIGLLAQQTPSPENGMTGLYWDPTVNSALAQKFTNAYQLAVMEQMLPQFFDLYVAVDWIGGHYNSGDLHNQYANQLNSGTRGYAGLSTQPTALPTPDPNQTPQTPMLLDQFSTPVDAQGSLAGMWDVGWLYMPNGSTKGSKLTDPFLTSQLAQDVQEANPYLLYNGLGAWAGSNASNPSIVANLGSNGSFTTITNLTPRALKVLLISSSSKDGLFGGGYGGYGSGDGNSNSSDYSSVNSAGVYDAVDRTLPPYGVLQFGAQGGSQSLLISVFDFSKSFTQNVAYFEQSFGNGQSSLCCGAAPAPYGYILTQGYVSGAQVANGRTPLIGIAGGD